jgi:uncharacterized membrane protein YfcA
VIFVVGGAVLIGVALGLLGAGGSILTMPILRYLLGQDAPTAITGSLLVVGGIALIAALPYLVAHAVEWRSVIFFGGPSMLGTYVAGSTLAPWLSELLGPRADSVKLATFGAIALLAALSMLRPRPLDELRAKEPRSAQRVLGDGLLNGLVTGLVGVGGGFLIVPSLVMLVGLSMRRAVATSLVIISAKSFTGFAGWYWAGERKVVLDLGVLAVFIGVGGLGSFAGRYLGHRLPQQHVQRTFALFLIAVAATTLVRELGLLFGEPQ